MKKKTIIIAGGSGFLGRHLENYYSQKGYEVKVLTRSPDGANDIYWDAKQLGPWVDVLDGAYALINMAGRSVNCRYTAANKAIILSSRLESTAVLHRAVVNCTQAPLHWLNSSTATIYEHTQGKAPANTEDRGVIGSGFSVEVAKQWEAEFFKFKLEHTRQTALRTAIVLGMEGGAFPVMVQLGRWGLCSPQGSGQQWISWIHIQDFLRAVDFILEQGIEGTINICSPKYIRNEDFNAHLQNLLQPSFVLPQPEFLLQIGAVVMGTETELILKSRKVFPERLLKSGFDFLFPGVKKAMIDLLRAEL
ncbi:MAG: TIGR01777 family oxidoreductase [Bacteroidota bacterium]